MPFISDNTTDDYDVVVPEELVAEDAQQLVPLTRDALAAMNESDLLEFYGFTVKVLHVHRIFDPLRVVLQNPVLRTLETANGMPYPRVCDSCGTILVRASFTTPTIPDADLCTACFCHLSLQDARNYDTSLTPTLIVLGDAPDGATRLQGATFVPGACSPESRCTICHESPTRHCFRAETGEVQCVGCYMKVERLSTTRQELIDEILRQLLQMVGTEDGDALYHCFRNGIDPLRYAQMVPREQHVRQLEGLIPEAEIRAFYNRQAQ